MEEERETILLLMVSKTAPSAVIAHMADPMGTLRCEGRGCGFAP